jgi:hypothetical protein
MRKLIIWPGMSRRIGACGLTHEALPVFLNGLRSELENQYQIYCILRDQEEPPLLPLSGHGCRRRLAA